MNQILSIIVPVYNASLYLAECVKGVVRQSYPHWELLLIDDGSTDDSLGICEAYSKKDTRIKSIHKQNSGVSATRNLGLDLARGEYIIFLDADDYWCDNTVLEKLLYAAENYKLDVVRGAYRPVTAVGEYLPKQAEHKGRLELAHQVLDSASFIKDIMHGEFFLVLSLIRKSTINKLRLNEGQIFLEDMRFYVQLLQNNLRCMYLPLCFYAYRRNSNSVSYQFNTKKLYDSFSMCSFFHECALNVSSQALKTYYNYYSVMMYRWTLETISLDGYYEKRQDIINELMLDDLCHCIRVWIRQEKINVHKFIFNIRPSAGIAFYRILGNLRKLKHTLTKNIKRNHSTTCS